MHACTQFQAKWNLHRNAQSAHKQIFTYLFPFRTMYVWHEFSVLLLMGTQHAMAQQMWHINEQSEQLKSVYASIMCVIKLFSARWEWISDRSPKAIITRCGKKYIKKQNLNWAKVIDSDCWMDFIMHFLVTENSPLLFIAELRLHYNFIYFIETNRI